MSIAVSVESEPSLGRTFSMAIAPIALMAVGAIAFLQFFDVFTAMAVLGTLGGMALVLLAYCVRTIKAADAAGKIRLIIADDGEISLIRYRKQHFPAAEQVEIVEMMQGSTLWSFFILLRLRQQNKNTIVVPFFRGSLSPLLFRRLSVACRWIAARNDVPQSAHQADFR